MNLQLPTSYLLITYKVASTYGLVLPIIYLLTIKYLPTYYLLLNAYLPT
jgi:hypothetical protein